MNEQLVLERPALLTLEHLGVAAVQGEAETLEQRGTRRVALVELRGDAAKAEVANAEVEHGLGCLAGEAKAME